MPVQERLDAELREREALAREAAALKAAAAAGGDGEREGVARLRGLLAEADAAAKVARADAQAAERALAARAQALGRAEGQARALKRVDALFLMLFTAHPAVLQCSSSLWFPRETGHAAVRHRAGVLEPVYPPWCAMLGLRGAGRALGARKCPTQGD